MMDAPPFMPYDSRGPAAAHMQRPVAAQYVVAPAYSSAPMTPLAALHYHSQQPFAYVPYQSPPPSTPIGSPYRQSLHERQGPRLVGPDGGDASRAGPYRRNSKQLSEVRLPSPSARSESQASTARSVVSNPAASSKTITYNETINPADRINFETDVDELMKVIQKKTELDDDGRGQAPTPAQTPNDDAGSGPHSPAQIAQPPQMTRRFPPLPM